MLLGLYMFLKDWDADSKRSMIRNKSLVRVDRVIVQFFRSISEKH